MMNADAIQISYARKKHGEEKTGGVSRSQWQWTQWCSLCKGLFCGMMTEKCNLAAINGELGFQNKECLYYYEGKQ